MAGTGAAGTFSIERTSLGVRLSGHRLPTGAAFELHDGERTFRAALDVPDGSLSGSAGSLGFWDLEPDLSIDWQVSPGASRDVFALAGLWAWDAVRRGGDEEPPAATDHDWQRFLGPLRWLKRHVHGLLVRERARVARRFRPADRLAVYRHLVRDPSGRTAQLAVACPGALLFTLALEGGDGVEQAVAAQLLADVREGRRLDRLLDAATTEWLRHAGPRWPRTARLGEADLPALAREHRQLLRRVSSFVSPGALASPLPVALDPSGVPAHPRHCARWLDTVRRAEREVGRRALADEPAAGLLSFVQHHWQAVAEPDRPGAPAEWLGQLLDYVGATGRVLDRASNRRAVMEQAYLHHINDWRGTVYPDELPLDAPALPAADGPGFVVRWFRTAGDLRRESEAMHHCVASYVEHARSGRGVFGRVELDGLPVTVHLAPRPTRWLLVEAKGDRNRALTADEESRLQRWLGTLPLPERPFPEEPPPGWEGEELDASLCDDRLLLEEP